VVDKKEVNVSAAEVEKTDSLPTEEAKAAEHTEQRQNPSNEALPEVVESPQVEQKDAGQTPILFLRDDELKTDQSC
jgi:hypothetical protein